MFVDQEKFHLVEFARISETQNNDFHDLGGDVEVGQEPKVDLHTDLVRISFEADAKQFDELFVRDVLKVDFQEMAHVIVFAVHFQNEVDLFCCTEEAFSIILSDTGLDGIVNENLFIEGLSVLSVVLGLQADALLVELVHVEFCGHLIESKSDDFIFGIR